MTLIELVEFITKYKCLYDTPNSEFFTKNVLHQLDQTWIPFLSSLKYEELNELPTKFHEYRSCPLSLKEFLHKAASLTRLGDVDNTHFDNNYKIKQVKAKKAHEMRMFYHALGRECRHMNIHRIVDVGCGLGHLLNYLRVNAANDGWLPECVGIEFDRELCCGAVERYEGAKIFNLKFTHDDAECRNAIAGLQPAALISLHGCGDLQASLLREFVDAPNSASLLMTVGCCYHKIRDVGKNWPMSGALKDIVPDDLKRPPASFFRLACQERLSRWDTFTAANHASHERAFLNRALAECIYRELGIDPKNGGSKRNTNRQLGHDVNALKEELLSRNGVNSAEDAARWNETFDQVFQRFKDDFRMVEAFTMLQFVMQGPLESLILLDRLLFLHENRIDAELVPIFDSKISPRNMCIIARIK